MHRLNRGRPLCPSDKKKRNCQDLQIRLPRTSWISAAPPHREVLLRNLQPHRQQPATPRSSCSFGRAVRGPADHSPHRSSCFCVSVLSPRARVTPAEGVAPIGGPLHMAVPSGSPLVLPGGLCPVLPSDLGCEGVFAHMPPSSCSPLFCTTLAQRPRPSQCPPRRKTLRKPSLTFSPTRGLKQLNHPSADKEMS